MYIVDIYVVVLSMVLSMIKNYRRIEPRLLHITEFISNYPNFLFPFITIFTLSSSSSSSYFIFFFEFYSRQMESIRSGGVGGGVVDGTEDESSTSVSASIDRSTSTSGGGRLCGINDAASV